MSRQYEFMEPGAELVTDLNELVEIYDDASLDSIGKDEVALVIGNPYGTAAVLTGARESIAAQLRGYLALVDKTDKQRASQSLHPALAETLSATQDAPMPTETQPAFHAVVHLVVPGVTADGRPITEAGAADYIAETLRDQFLDWAYIHKNHGEGAALQTPIQIRVSKPYVEGSFIGDVES